MEFTELCVRLAHELGAVWVECDVQTLNCGTHVLYHDEFATTKEGTLMRLKDATHHDLSLTRLEDALLNSAPSINFNLEIKYHGKSDDEVARMATQIAEAVHALAPKRRICFSCFHPAACIDVAEHSAAVAQVGDPEAVLDAVQVHRAGAAASEQPGLARVLEALVLCSQQLL